MPAVLKDVSAAVPIKNNMNIAKVMRDIAGEIESGEIPCDHATVIAGFEVYCLGPVDGCRAAESAIFDMTFGIHKLMNETTKDR